ncbi:MAG: aldolase [Firmicutes bacterium]|nr:aldolase [Bacillota bacterium]
MDLDRRTRVALPPNPVKEALKLGQAVFGTMISELRSPQIAQMMVVAGFEYIIVDMEHSNMNNETVADMILGARAAGIVSIVRVPSSQDHLLSRPLDAGAQGLLVPRLETRDQVEAVVRFSRYHPIGSRGAALARAHSGFVKVDAGEYMRLANERVLVAIQVETGRAVANVDEMPSVPGIDVAFIGPMDLSQSLGVPGEFDHPLMVDAIRKVIASSKRHGLAVGIHVARMDLLRKWYHEGMRMLTFSDEIKMIVETGSRFVDEIQGFVEAQPTEP